MITPAIKTVLFDLDGTLIDHFHTIYRCYAHSLETMGLEPCSFETVKAAVGGGIRVTFSRLVPPEYVERGVKLWMERFVQIWDQDIEVLPGVDALLTTLKVHQVNVGMLTNKEGVTARKISTKLNWDDRLKAVYGRLDTEWSKPAPELTRHVLGRLGADPTTAIMIGDSPFDIETATNVGMRVFAVATGSHSVEDLRQTAANGVYPHLPALARDLWGWQIY